VIGLCFGGGQYGLGLSALTVALAALWAMKPLEGYLRRERRAILTLTRISEGPSADDVRLALAEAGYQVLSGAVAYTGEAVGRRRCMARYEVTWRRRCDGPAY
jgi:putative Mg2+ transporter-C (MgtC) family protein